jgi:hypothetical protein
MDVLDLPRDVQDQLIAAYPELWQKCYPRIYQEPKCGQFHSVKHVAWQMFGVANKIDLGIFGEAEKPEIFWASTLAQYRVPTFWVGKDMATAIQQTTPPVEVDWHDMHLPFEAAAFIVPKNCLTHEDKDEGEAVFVSYARCKQGHSVPSLAPTGPTHYTCLNGNIVCMANTTPGGHLMHWNYTKNEMPVINLAKLDELVMGFAGHEHLSGWFYRPHMTKEDNMFMAKVTHFIFGVILLMEARPELVTRGTMLKRVKNKKGHQRVNEFWSPNVIGEHYKIRQLSMPQGGTHASPRFHWVRVYYKEQPYGSRPDSLRKTIWVEPYTRGMDEG